MKAMVGLWAIVVLGTGISAAPRDDAAALIEKLKSKDKDDAENAREDLLKLGSAAIAPLREAAGKSQDAEFKKLAGGLADRLETRKASAGVAKAWGDRWFTLYVAGLHVGWVHMKAEEKEGRIVLTDEIKVQQNKDVTFEVRATLTCEPDEYLSLAAVTLDIASPENTLSATAQVKDGRLVVKAGGDTKATKLRPNTVVDLAVFPLVTILPRTEGYEVEVLQLIKPKLPTSGIIKFDKEESIEYEGRKVKARRFILADGESGDKFYWVDASNKLLRVQLKSDDDKDVEIILSDEKRAKDIDTKD